MTLDIQVKDFYSELKFPGPYSIADLEFYDEEVVNDYLKIIDSYVAGNSTVLDVGCGSGFIVNFLARRHPNIKFDAIDFSDSIGYAQHFSQTNNITNISYHKDDFLTWPTDKKYDVVLCNGVLHHMPLYPEALAKIKTLTDNQLIMGIYNTYGKLAKKYFKINYTNKVLYNDQEHCPFEVSFNDSEFRGMFTGYTIEEVYPSYKNRLVDLINLFNYQNGGLTVYIFTK